MTRVEALVARLHGFYGALPVPPADPFGFYVWEILGARTMPSRREAALAALRRIPALTPDAIRRAPPSALEAAVRMAGPDLDDRLQALRRGAGVFRQNPRLSSMLGGSLLSARRALVPLSELDRAAVHRLLLFAAGHPLFPVDDGIARLGLRIGYASPASSRRLELRAVGRALGAEVPPGLAPRRHIALHLAHHAAVTCTESAPHCRVCPLLDECSYGRRGTA